MIRASPSSSLVALYEACCAVRSGDARSAVVAGSSLVPAFDGVAEMGEAVSAVYIKTLPDAIRDGNPIRAVIRECSAGNIACGQSAGSDVPEESAPSLTSLVKAVITMENRTMTPNDSSCEFYSIKEYVNQMLT